MTRSIALTTILGLCAVAALGLDTSAEAAAPATSQTSQATAESAPTPAAAAAGLCGITAADVADIVDYYGLDPDMPALQAALATPFDCSAYGLCSDLTNAEAHAYACGVWSDLQAHVAPRDVLQNATNHLAMHLEACGPDWDVCEQACEPRDVFTCQGMVFRGECGTIWACTEMLDFLPPWGFEQILEKVPF